MKLVTVPAATRFRSEIARAKALGFTTQVRVDRTPSLVAYVRLTPATPNARAACAAHRATALEAKQAFDHPTEVADAISTAMLAALDMCAQAA